jgi:hypothetical protein
MIHSGLEDLAAAKAIPVKVLREVCNFEGFLGYGIFRDI